MPFAAKAENWANVIPSSDYFLQKSVRSIMGRQLVTVFGATGAQGGAVCRRLLSSRATLAVRAVTRNKSSPAALKLSREGAEVVEADMNDYEALEKAVIGAHFVFVVTSFYETRDAKQEQQQAMNVAQAVINKCAHTLEAYIWSSLPDPRTQPQPLYHMTHFNSKAEVTKFLRHSSLASKTTEIWMSAYYENYLQLSEVYGPQKEADNRFTLVYPLDPNTEMPFTSAEDLGLVVEKIVTRPDRFTGKTVSVISQSISPVEQLRIWSKVLQVQARFQSATFEEFKQCLITKYNYPEDHALAMTENMATYKLNPKMWFDGASIMAVDILDNMVDYETYVKHEDWSMYTGELKPTPR